MPCFEHRPDSGRRTLTTVRGFHKIVGLVDDAVLLLLAVFLFPLIILLVGAPIALLVRVVIEIAHRF